MFPETSVARKLTVGEPGRDLAAASAIGWAVDGNR